MPSSGLANYDIGEVIGAGTVGTIYAAIHRETGEKVAIKKLHAGVSQDPLIRARFKRETVVMERLRHPNIIRSMGGGEENGQLFYVMELLDGGTVKDLLQTKRVLRWPVVVEIARQICSALQFAHNHGVIHRDLKPSNLFLTREAEVKLGDFGIARDLQGSDITSSGMTVGTHAYMAPEQITGDANVKNPFQITLVLSWKALRKIINKAFSQLCRVVNDERVVDIYKYPEQLAALAKNVKAGINCGARETPIDQKLGKELSPLATSLFETVQRSAQSAN